MASILPGRGDRFRGNPGSRRAGARHGVPRRPWYGRGGVLAAQRGATGRAGRTSLPELYSGIARGWIAALPAAAERIRAAGPKELPAALHESRSGAVAVGLAELPAVLAGIEQEAEAGRPPGTAALEDSIALAERSAAALGAWWDPAA